MNFPKSDLPWLGCFRLKKERKNNSPDLEDVIFHACWSSAQLFRAQTNSSCTLLHFCTLLPPRTNLCSACYSLSNHVNLLKLGLPWFYLVGVSHSQKRSPKLNVSNFLFWKGSILREWITLENHSPNPILGGFTRAREGVVMSIHFILRLTVFPSLNSYSLIIESRTRDSPALGYRALICLCKSNDQMANNREILLLLNKGCLAIGFLIS